MTMPIPSGRTRLFYLGLAIVGLCAWAAVAQENKPRSADDEFVVVTVEAEGEDKEKALKAALRAALEQGGKQEIFSDTKVQNFQLMHDTIITRAQGIVKDYEILEERKVVGGTIKVKIRAKVSKSVLARSWGELQNVLNQIGRPKILVWINERIDKQPEELSILETLIEKPLIASGFDMVARQAIDASKQKELADAAAEDNVAKLQAVAKEFDAHIFIAGTCNADAAGVKVLYGEPVAMYNGDIQVKAYYTDSAKLLASEGIPDARGGAQGNRDHSPQAGKKALANMAQPLVDSLYGQIMEQWATAISAGGELILEVNEIKVPAARKLKKAIEEIEGVEHVNYDFTKGVARYRINAKLSAEDLSEHLSEGDFEKMIEITDVKLNRIQAKALGK